MQFPHLFVHQTGELYLGTVPSETLAAANVVRGPPHAPIVQSNLSAIAEKFISIMHFISKVWKGRAAKCKLEESFNPGVSSREGLVHRWVQACVASLRHCRTTNHLHWKAICGAFCFIYCTNDFHRGGPYSRDHLVHRRRIRLAEVSLPFHLPGLVHIRECMAARSFWTSAC